MIGCFKKTREEIVQIIKKCEITADGYYVCKNFQELNNSIGDKLDKKYKFSRYYFENKICFSQADIEIYLEVNENNYDIDRMKQRDDYVYNIIKNEVNVCTKITEKVHNSSFTLEELIDTSIFVFNNKY